MATIHSEVRAMPRTRTGVRNLDVMGPGVVPFSGEPTTVPGPVRPLGTTDRSLSSAAGAALVWAGVCRGSLGGLALAGLGGYLLYRGLAGRCPVSEAAGMARRAPAEPAEVLYRAG